MKRFLTTILWFCAAYLGFAQTAIGVKINSPASTFTIITPIQSMEGYNVEYFGKTGVVNSGLFLRMPIKTHFASQIELMYKREAIPYRPEGSDLKLQDRRHIRFDYLEMPFLLQFEGKKWFRGFGQIGLAPKVLLLASYSEKQNSEKFNMTQYFNKILFTFHVGGGVMWEIPKWIFTADARFSTNLTPITDQEHVPHLYFKDAKSYYFAISIGAGLKLSKNKNQEPAIQEPVYPSSEEPVYQEVKEEPTPQEVKEEAAPQEVKEAE